MNLLITGGAGFIGSNLIHHIFGELQLMRAEMRCQRSNKPRALLAEEVLGDLADVHA